MDLMNKFGEKLNFKKEQVEITEIITGINNACKLSLLKPLINYDKVNKALIILFNGGISIAELVALEEYVFSKGYVMIGSRTETSISECIFVKRGRKI